MKTLIVLLLSFITLSNLSAEAQTDVSEKSNASDSEQESLLNARDSFGDSLRRLSESIDSNVNAYLDFKITSDITPPGFCFRVGEKHLAAIILNRGILTAVSRNPLARFTKEEISIINQLNQDSAALVDTIQNVRRSCLETGTYDVKEAEKFNNVAYEKYLDITGRLYAFAYKI